MKNFINLRVYTDHSIGKSVITVEKMIDFCLMNKIPSIAITDYNNLFASLQFSLSCQKNGLQPLIGLTLTTEFTNIENISKYFADIILIAATYEGYQNLLYLNSQSYLQQKQHYSYINWQLIQNYSNGLILICGQYNSPIEKLYNNSLLQEGIQLIKQFKNIFKNNFFIEISRPKNFNRNYEFFLLSSAYDISIPIVATNLAQYISKKDFIALDTYICLNKGKILIEKNRDKADKNNLLQKKDKIYEIFYDIPEAIENTELIAKKCSFFLLERKTKLPDYKKTPKEEKKLLIEISYKNLIIKLKKIKSMKQNEYFERIRYELYIINKMNFASYFLIVSDFVYWSKSQSIPVGTGRGSGAGSLIAWVLGISEVDPIEFDLLFERFLNPARISIPDFDIDFCQIERDKVIEYIRNKYGHDNIAHIITFGKLQARAALRDVGRVLQIPYLKVNEICKLVPNNPANPVTLAKAILLDEKLKFKNIKDNVTKQLIEISLSLEGLNRNVSKHAAGIIISKYKLIKIAPLYLDNESTIPIVQYSLKHAEKIGLVKFDFLGLKTLTIISLTLKLIKNKTAKSIQINKLTLNNQNTFSMLSGGKSIGIFQFESSGMKSTIKNIKPDCIEDLIALGSLYRPGPMENISEYILRKHNSNKINYTHPQLKHLLKETYGIIIYQEQVMRIAQILANYSLGEADLLRRAMGKKVKTEMKEQKEKFIAGCQINNINKNDADTIFHLVKKFASYGFNKSHAAAYALISYQTAYLKANFSREFIVASLNLDIDNTDKTFTFICEAKKFRIMVLSPDINKSVDSFTIEGNAIRFAMLAIKGVGKKVIQEIIKERNYNGPFANIYDFFNRITLMNKKMIDSLIKSGALDCFGFDRETLLKNVLYILKYTTLQNENIHDQLNLFSHNAVDKFYANFNYSCKKSEKNKLRFEFEVFGFYLNNHPLTKYKDFFNSLDVTNSEEIFESKKHIINILGVITNKRIRSTYKGKYAFLQLTDLNGMIDIAIFNEEILLSNIDILYEGNLIYAKIEIKKKTTNNKIIVKKIYPLEYVLKKLINININIKNIQELIFLNKCNNKKNNGIILNINISINGYIIKLKKSDSNIYINEKKFFKYIKNKNILYSITKN